MSKAVKSSILNIHVIPLLLLFLFVSRCGMSCMASSKQEYYQIRIYIYSNKLQEDRLDNFLKDAYLPALHSAGISKAGVFKPIESDTAYGKRIYVLIPFKSMDQFLKLPALLEKDQVYKDRGKDYLDAKFNDPPYDRMESIILKAFADMPELLLPQHSTPPRERIYELRNYMSSTEKLLTKKIHMFNQGGVIKLFEKHKFNAVFCGKVISGNKMPNLMYMTTFADKTAREEHWSDFRTDSDWKALSGLAEYQNTTSKSQTFFLYPTDYSDI